MRIGLFTNNYLPFCGGVTISVETLRRGLEARGHEAWTFAPRFPGAVDEAPRVVRFPSMPAGDLSGVRAGRAVVAAHRAPGRTSLDLDVFHAHHPFLLGPAARRLGPAGRAARSSSPITRATRSTPTTCR